MAFVTVVGQDRPYLVFEKVCVYLDGNGLYGCGSTGRSSRSLRRVGGCVCICGLCRRMCRGVAPYGSCLDPSFENGDIRLVERDLRRHLQVASAANCLNQQARIGVAGNDDGTVFTAFSDQSIGKHLQAAQRGVVMTFQAVGREDWGYALFVKLLRTRCRRVIGCRHVHSREDGNANRYRARASEYQNLSHSRWLGAREPSSRPDKEDWYASSLPHLHSSRKLYSVHVHDGQEAITGM